MPTKIEFGPADLGELDGVLHNQGISDLSWLAVDEAEYRAKETLPKQNLDIIPELQKALAFEPGDSIPSLIPMKPHVVVNRNPVDVDRVSAVDMTVPIRNRVATMVMQGLTQDAIKEKLLLEFSKPDLRLATASINEVVRERGLLGNVYINSEHFPRCAQRESKDLKIASGPAKKSLFVLASSKCNDCTCNKSGQCSVFKKTIVSSIPYSANLLSHYFPNTKTDTRTASGSDVKTALQTAFLAPKAVVNPDGVKTVAYQPKVTKPTFTDEQINSVLAARSSDPSATRISTTYAKYAKRMMEGKDDREYLRASGDPELIKLASEFGLLGHTYVDMDALGGCRKTLAHIQNHGIAPDFIIRRSSCGICKNTTDGACARLCDKSNVVHSMVSIDKSHLAAALNRAVSQSRIASESASNVLRNCTGNENYRVLTSQANLMTPVAPTSVYSKFNAKAHYGTSQKVSPTIDESDLSNFISKLLNIGLTGKRLASAILSRYSKEDLKNFIHVSARFASEEGIQGHYYVDPTAYSDYGRGCSEGAKLFRKQGPHNILASSSCIGCTLQTSPGWCSKYSKTMIRSVPDSVRKTASDSKNLLPIISVPVINPVSEFGLSNDLSVDTNGLKSRAIDISLIDRTLDP